MSSKFRNVFLVFGVLVVVIMLFSFDMKYDELWNNLKLKNQTWLFWT